MKDSANATPTILLALAAYTTLAAATTAAPPPPLQPAQIDCDLPGECDLHLDVGLCDFYLMQESGIYEYKWNSPQLNHFCLFISRPFNLAFIAADCFDNSGGTSVRATDCLLLPSSMGTEGFPYGRYAKQTATDYGFVLSTEEGMDWSRVGYTNAPPPTAPSSSPSSRACSSRAASTSSRTPPKMTTCASTSTL